jgi:CHAT domain-containing protein
VSDKVRAKILLFLKSIQSWTSKTRSIRSFVRNSRQNLLSFLWLGFLAFLVAIVVVPLTAQYPQSSIAQVPSHSVSNLIEKGRILYEAGRFSEAAALWQQSAQNYDIKNDRLNQSLSLSYLSLAYQELGLLPEAENAIASSLNLINNSSINHSSSAIVLAQALNIQGRLQLAAGQTEAALDTWKKAEASYTKAGDETGILGSQINQAQALQTLGLYRRAKATLEQANQKLQAQPNSILKATGLRSLGVALQAVGDLRESQKILEQSLLISQQLQTANPEAAAMEKRELSATFLSLGNTARALQDAKSALTYYRQAAQLSSCTTTQNNCQNNHTSIQALLNELSLSIETENLADINSLLPQIQNQITNLPPSRATVYALVNYAQSLIVMETPKERASGDNSAVKSVPIPVTKQAAQVLASAIQQATTLQDLKAESYALGELGKLYEQSTQWEDARKLTQQALIIAQGISADNIAARWQWQLGRIHKQQRNLPMAIAAYSEAVKTLQSLRTDLVTINQDVQFSFRESVEPVYRELVELLLDTNPSQENLKEARKLIEALQLAELDNFFREACLDVKPQQIDEVDPQAAVFYPIILSERLAVILSLPKQPLRYYETKLPKNNLETTLDEMLQSLNPAFSSQERLRLSEQVYTWLIQPSEADLVKYNIKTLVFVLDGILRNLPMAALYDGKQYLIEKYSVAITPGLQLLEARGLGQRKIKALTGGLTDARQGFSALPAVKSEINQISLEIPSQVLLNQDFSEVNLQKQIRENSFPVIHLATHGQFSSNPEETFILTWNEKINVRDFEKLLSSSNGQNDSRRVELLVLSACQTAAGDSRAALGLAGVAVRSGASSTLATLWSVRDDSTATLMAEFYRELAQPNITKAEALRLGQLALLKQSRYEHPFYWAPFVLVGNWL